jgi:hypothetical protein
VIQGAEFFAIVKHRLMDEKTRNAFFADLRAAYLGAEVKAGVDQKVANTAREYQMNVQLRQIVLQSKPASAYDPFR